jgi:FkbM family methyltransferase
MRVEPSGGTLKHCSQSILRRLGAYERVRASWIHEVYWSVADRRMIQERRAEIEFYQGLLAGFRKGDLIFDIGANQGDKTDVFLRLGARVVAVEPDDGSQEILRRRFVRYRLKGLPLSIVGKAVSDGRRSERMWIETPGSARNTLSPKWVGALTSDESRFGERVVFGQWKDVQTISMQDLFSSYGLPFFVKIDVEGHELKVLQGMARPVRYLSFEVNLPEFRPEGIECVRVLRELGGGGRFNYTADCRRGLVLKQWLRAPEFLSVLEQCSVPSVEVFWTSGAHQSRGERHAKIN